MKRQVLIHSPDGTAIKARTLLDFASFSSFISESLTQSLRLPRSSQNVKITYTCAAQLEWIECMKKANICGIQWVFFVGGLIFNDLHLK